MTPLSRRQFVGIGASATAGALLALDASPAFAATVPQAGPVPVVLETGTGTDADLTVLMAAAAERSDALSVYVADPAKNFWVDNFRTADDFLAWTVSAPAVGTYRVTVLLSAAAGQQFKVAVRGGGPSFTFTAAAGWQRVDVGTLVLPKGASTIELTRTGTLSGDVRVKSLEVLLDADEAPRRQRIAAARAAADTSWLHNAVYGLMFQYGAWGFPDNVGPAKSLEQQAADFDVPRFVKTVEETGAAFVIWSYSWWGFRPDGPNAAIDTIMGSGDYTATRDLIGEVAKALKAKGIRFALYYHEGKEEAGWWNKQNFPATFPRAGAGDRSTFLANWKAVVTDIGSRYGTDLDGFFFDDGIVYYPAPFEEFERVARTGNPHRVVSWNSWELPRLTEFQDVYFGEGHQGSSMTGSGPDGVFTSGPYEGLVEHGMFTMENDWGVHVQNQKITTSVTSAEAIGWVGAASRRKVPLSFNLMMYEDGTMAESSLAVLNDLRQAVRGTAPALPTGTTTVNDNETTAVYSGSWSRSTGRGAGDYGDDVSYTTADGSYVDFTFTGTGVDVLAPFASNGASGQITVDGKAIGTFSESATAYRPQQVVYSARHLPSGAHTVRLAKTSGTYWQIDAFRTVPNRVTYNNDASLIAYHGTWSRAANRGVGDYGDDVCWTKTNGDSFTVTFTGTGLVLSGPMSSADGNASVSVDGAGGGTLSATYGGNYKPQQTLWTMDHLTPGQHTVTVTKTGGTYLQLDSVTVIP
ncbi:alpha-L-fucosidase [Streptomyces coerulescens]|uniref:Alpha-L-fucosidase n=1 Tax=Streptomyces coerulescens TaxID=29304 RepID=A0ABW0D0S1_STRCD